MQRTVKRARRGLVLALGALSVPIMWGLVANAVGTNAGAAQISPTSGDSDTDFTLTLPAGAACTGDSADGGFVVTSYMVPAAVDVATLQFDPIGGPNPINVGADFRQPLYETTSAAFAARQTANADAPGGPGLIVNIPQFDLAVFSPGDIPAGVYNIGIACILGAPDADQLDKFWNEQITVTTDVGSGGPAQITWGQGAGATTTTTVADSTTTTGDGGSTTTTTVTGSTTTAPVDTTTTTAPVGTTTTTEPVGTTTTTAPVGTTTTTEPLGTTTTTEPVGTTTTTAPVDTTTTTAPVGTTSTTTAGGSTTSTTTGATTTTSTTLPAGTTISPTTVASGGAVTVTSTGWEPQEEVEITLFSDPVDLTPLKADATGKISGTVTIPTTTPLGAHELELAGFDTDGDPRVVTAGITVVAPPSTTSTTDTGGTVPRTGSDVGPQLLIGALLVGLGGVLVEAARRRHATR